MIVNYQNVEEYFSNRSFHDYFFEDLSFEYDNLYFYLGERRETRFIKLVLLDSDLNEEIIVFHNVIGCEFTSCEFWGPSPHIDCISYLEDEEKIVTPKLLKRFMAIPEKAKYLCLLNDNKTYIEIKIQLLSGDVVLIACKSFELL